MSENTPMPTNKPEVVLPELPASYGDHCVTDSVRTMREPGYTADQLRAYGQACIDTLTRPADGERMPTVPQAFFDEFGVNADDRVMDYGRACYEAALANQQGVGGSIEAAVAAYEATPPGVDWKARAIRAAIAAWNGE